MVERHEKEEGAEYKLFRVEGIRHNAVVVARDEEEACRLADEVSERHRVEQVLYGHVDADWETPYAFELKLPPGFKLVKEEE